MPNDYFQFKQFLVKQGGAAFKVGTDGVLLGAWATVHDAISALDIGTGSGLIALMLAQRMASFRGGRDTQITAIDIDRAACEQAGYNFRNSPWKDRISLFHQSFQEFSSEMNVTFDTIVSNPPFFMNSYKPDNRGRDISRHDTLLGMETLAAGVLKLLAPGGRFSVILPVEESIMLQGLFSDVGMYLSSICRVFPTSGSAAKRHLLEFSRIPAIPLRESALTIEGEGRHDYTEDYRELTRDFYLGF